MLWIAAVAALLAPTHPEMVYGQERQRDRDESEVPRAEGARPDRESYRDAQGRRTRPFSPRFDPRSKFYRDGSRVRRFDEAFQDELDRAYQRGVEDGRQLERYDIQAERGASTYQGAMAKGKGAFETGDYGLAARHFLLAATLDQGAPAARLAAAHALVAVDAYDEAARLLRRAFELQPRLVYLPLEIRGAYGNPDHFALHLTALRAAAQNDEHNPGIWLLLGYFSYYSDHMAQAADALGRAAKLRPKDRLIQRLFELASLSVPRNARDPNERKPQP